MHKNRALLFVLFSVLIPQQANAEIPLLTFCLGDAPTDQQRLDYYNNQCPDVILLAQEQGQASSEANAAKAKAELQKAQLENLAKAFPAQTPAAAKDTDIAGFKHFAEFRQASLLILAAETMVADIKSTYKGQKLLTRLLTDGEMLQLRTSTLPVSTLTDELDLLEKKATTIKNSCKPGGPAPSWGTQRIMGGGGLIALDSLLGISLKISQAFQTSLGDSEAAPLSGADVMLANSLAQAWLKDGVGPLYIGLPAVTKSNTVVTGLTKLRKSSDELIAAMSKSDEKSACRTDGKALLDAISARIAELNKAPDAATPSPMLTTMRWAELEGGGMDTRLLTVRTLHTGGSVAATKTAFTSQRTTALATVVASYRIEDLKAEVIASRVVSCPGTATELDAARYTKDFKGDPKDKRQSTCK